MGGTSYFSPAVRMFPREISSTSTPASAGQLTEFDHFFYGQAIFQIVVMGVDPHEQIGIPSGIFARIARIHSSGNRARFSKAPPYSSVL